MFVTFDKPVFLLLAIILLPLLIHGWRSMIGMDRMRRILTLFFRSSLTLSLCVILAGPHFRQQHHHLTVIGLLDISGSVRRFAKLPEIPELGRSANIEYLRRWFREATDTKAPDDRFGLVVFDGDAIAISAPTKGDYVDDNLDVAMHEGTNIAQAVSLGLAMFPADTAKRLVLISDGNETSGDLLAAARQAAGGSGLKVQQFDLDRLRIPIDILPITYTVTGDVQVVRVEAPPNARPGQTVTVRIILEATEPTEGSLTLLREGRPNDINGRKPGYSRHVSLAPGQSVHLAQVVLGNTPINRFEAIFEASDPTTDIFVANNRAEAFTATPAKGTVLVVDRMAGQQSNYLVDLLNAADIPSSAQSPEQFPLDLLTMQAYDLIILDNIAASELSIAQHQLINTFVRDFGGGLIMVGGENGFGAGGWNGTTVEDVLPLELNPPQELRLPTAALVLVLDKSGSMHRAVAGARATQQEIANEAAALAIESLRSESIVGVIAFNLSPEVVVPLQRNTHPEQIAKRIRGIRADGGTDLASALIQARAMLDEVEASRKRIVCLSDGQSLKGDFEKIARDIVDADIKLTTIAVGDQVDTETLSMLADIGGGEFYPVRNPRILPRVLVDSVQVINKPLIKEIQFVPEVLPSGSSLTIGMENAPVLDGLVITSTKPDPKVVLEMISPDGEPLLAHWQIGLGRVAAFTSDAQGQWSKRWLEWEGAELFWMQLARTIARPAVSQDAELITEIIDDRLHIALEVADEDGGFFDYLQVQGRVYTPDGSAIPVRLRQSAPGRYEGSVEARFAGNYIVALNPRQGLKQLSPVIGGINRPTSIEYRTYQSNSRLLEQVAEITGGRRLDLNLPRAVDLFDRTNMPPSISILPAWHPVLLLALSLFLLDIATRRLAWNTDMIKGGLASAISKVRPGHVRAKKAAVTLASLRRVSESFDDKLDSESSGLEKLKGTGVIAPPPDRIEPLHPIEELHRERIISAAFDRLLGRRSSSQKEPSETETPDQPSSTVTTQDSSSNEESATDASETTSSLLAAKRRARRRMDG
ncbi:MAG: VWA domain-containing protein [Planctomycetes bacterium]|nr:VWA domain-containing protein [Planctomycetota bacterium]